MKVVINNCYGGFTLSCEAKEMLRKMGVAPDDIDFEYHFLQKRACPKLVQVVEELGAKASGEHAELVIVLIPDDVKFSIGEYDGVEWVQEQHRTWQTGPSGKTEMRWR